MNRKQLLLLSFVAVAFAAAAQTLPKQKAGLWQDTTTMLNADGTAYRIGTGFSSTVVKPSTVTRCIDEEMAARADKIGRELLAGYSGQRCRQLPLAISGNQMKSVTECEIGSSVQRISSITIFDSEASYRGEARIVYDPPVDGMTEMVVRSEHIFLGPCKAGMRAGDVTLDGVAVNILDLAPAMVPKSAADVARLMDKSADGLASIFEQNQKLELQKLEEEAQRPEGVLGVADILVTVANVAAGVKGKGGGASRNAQVVGATANALSVLAVGDEQVKRMASSFIRMHDREFVPLAETDVYSKRLFKLTKNFTSYDGVQLNFKVFKSDVVNAFAVPDGSVRVHSALMDLMDDDELRFVIGHEIGHVKYGHSAAQTKAAFLTAAVANGAAAAAMKSGKGEAVVNVAGDSLKELFKKVLGSAYSREQEYESDRYAFKFMKANRIPVRAAVGALTKLSSASGNRTADLYSTHPSGPDRVAAIKRAAEQQ
jgi:putative metalloprotease